MKKLNLLLCLVFLITISKAQPWLQNLPTAKPANELTFYDYVDAFNNYW